MQEFLETGRVFLPPTAVLATALVLLAFLPQVCGLALDNVPSARRKRSGWPCLAYKAPACRP
ncbi:hypothetical protein ACFQS7_08325 [Dankookia sp. GCM10030260]